MRILKVFFLLSFILLSSCYSSKRLLEKGRYEKSIDVAVRKLIRKPGRSDEAMVLKHSYEIANKRNEERIRFLRLSGQPDIWPEVFKNLDMLKSRQSRVSVLPKAVLDEIGFQHIDYDSQIIEARRNAAGYFFANGNRLLNKGDRFSARTAYEEFSKVKQYSPAYPDVDSKMHEAEFRGTSFVFFSIQNHSGTLLPPGFEEEMFRISLHELNRKWLTFHTVEFIDYIYAYRIQLNLRNIAISPEQIREKSYTEEKKIEDGWEYELDRNGNVKKDSLGNDIKVKKFSTVRCDVIETEMHKSSVINATLDIIDILTIQIIKTEPLTAGFTFEHRFAIARGNFKALSPETRKLLDMRPLPFPGDGEMILMNSDVLKQMTKDIIRRNRSLLR